MAKAISIEPSGDFDGYDGNWGTFFVQVGTPPQQVKVLPSTSGQGTLLVSPKACKNNNATCLKDRGFPFDYTKSKTVGFWDIANDQDLTWVPQNELYLRKAQDIYEQETLTETSTAIDNMTVGSIGAETLRINETLIGTIEYSVKLDESFTYGPYMGRIGLSAYAINMLDTSAEGNSTWPSNRQSSMLEIAKISNQIPSMSYGYTAGAFYRNNQGSAPASLTLGGYDRSRLLFENTTFGLFNSDNLILKLIDVALDEVKIVPNRRKLSDYMRFPTGGLSLAIDSDVSFMWLPRSLCNHIADFLGLRYDSTMNLYFFNESLPTLRDNNSFTFTFQATDATNVSINFPYTAFDLDLDLSFGTNSPPNKTRYFPMRSLSGPNEQMGTLGRVFLQETYLIVDYERRNFSIHQARFDKKDKDIVTIEPAPPDSSHSPNRKFPQSLKIVLPIIVFIILALISFTGYKLWKRRKNYQVHPEGSIDNSAFEKGELSATDARQEMSGQMGGFELDSKLWVELPGCVPEQPPLLDGTGLTTEMDAGIAAHEAPASEKASVALDDEDQSSTSRRSFSFERRSHESNRLPIEKCASQQARTT